MLLGLQPPLSSFTLQLQHSRDTVLGIVTAQCSGTSGAPGERWVPGASCTWSSKGEHVVSVES